MAYRAFATPPVDTEGEQDSAPMRCALCPAGCNERMEYEDPFTRVNGQYYCWQCFIALEAAGQCDGLTYIRAVEDTLEKLEQAKKQAKEKKEELSDYELKILVIKWRHENEKRSRDERRRKRRRKNN